MRCPECGERMTGLYDGGEPNNYELCLPSCDYCGYIHWDLLNEDDEEEDDGDMPAWVTNDAEDRYNRGGW